MSLKAAQLPAIVAGPILRKVTPHQLTFWLVTTKPFQFSCWIKPLGAEQALIEQQLNDQQVHQVQVGEFAYINLLNITFDKPLPTKQILHYDLRLHDSNSQQRLTELLPTLCYPGQDYPSFIIDSHLHSVAHGSCRKPHCHSDDALVRLDEHVEESLLTPQERPNMLMMSGDQVYVDDVAGPMLVAIHQVIDMLGLYDESWQGAEANNSEALRQSPYCYYQRDKLLPYNSANKVLYDKFFAASKKPIFTSVNAKNHLVTLSEVLAMYMLVWSDELWLLVELANPDVTDEQMTLYQREQKEIERFIKGLPQVRRVLAHLPVYMIFDDHDVTDDWNLTRGWEEAAYNHPFSKRIIGNALVGYYLCQGWGNAPEAFNDISEHHDKYFTPQGLQSLDDLIDIMLDWQQWHYTLETSPKMIVLDTRTRRWRSESNAGKPSGLMDWEALSELQQELINEPSVILVSAAPIYGVKLIETVQRIFTFLGQPLMVDAENWMAHKGTANVMLNIFRHPKTPPNFIILSGDVHYSFVYEVTHRFKRSSSKILQVTCSGIKNQFPAKLLIWFERLNRFLYASYSPLNWFTKRRGMKVKVRKPIMDGKLTRSTLVNQSGIGLLHLSEDACSIETVLLTKDQQAVSFQQVNEEDD